MVIFVRVLFSLSSWEQWIRENKNQQKYPCSKCWFSYLNPIMKLKTSEMNFKNSKWLHIIIFQQLSGLISDAIYVCKNKIVHKRVAPLWTPFLIASSCQLWSVNEYKFHFNFCNKLPFFWLHLFFRAVWRQWCFVTAKEHDTLCFSQVWQL